jgi:hypothetical protein
MDNSLWLFGDSFSAQPNVECDFIVWPELIARHFKLPHYWNWARMGCANDFIFHEFTSHINEMKEGDFVIVQTTSPNRQWFFEDPEVGNYLIQDLEKYVTADQKKAVDHYIKHLQSDKIDDLRYTQFGLALERLGAMVPHLRILVLPAFYTLPGIIGHLTQVSDGEHVSVTPEAITKWYKDNDGNDPRVMHLSKQNHPILAQKIIEFFETGKSIDLTTGFDQGFIK